MGIIGVLLISNMFVTVSANAQQINISKDIILTEKSLNLEINDVNKGVEVLISKFKNRPVDISLVEEIALNEQRLIDYVEISIKNNISQSELLVLLQMLSLVDSNESNNLLASVGLQFVHDIEIQISLLKLFSELPETSGVSTYFDSFFTGENKNNLNLLRAALLSLSMSNSSKVNRMAVRYRSPGTSSNVRFIGLYMASILGEDEMLKHWILQTLLDEIKPPSYQHYYLLVALSRQMSDIEFNDFLSRSYVSKAVIDSVKMERLFHRSDAVLRLKMASALIKSNYADQRNTAISFLLEEQGFEKTWQQLNQQYRLSVIRLSYKLGIPTKAADGDKLNKYYYFGCILILSVIGMAVYVGFVRKKISRL